MQAREKLVHTFLAVLEAEDLSLISDVIEDPF
jgi:hypothetical protein